MHKHTFRLINETRKNSRDYTRIYQCVKCGFTLEERKINRISYYYVVSKENRT